VPGTQASISFAEGRISGSTGCNRFSGSFAVARDRLTAGPLITTRRACTRWTGRQEQALLALLGKRLEVSSTRAGKLVLEARDGRRLVLARDRTEAARYGIEPRAASQGGGTDGD
jgi:heat shock protein HslJ